MMFNANTIKDIFWIKRGMKVESMSVEYHHATRQAFKSVKYRTILSGCKN
jgi:hypothetical protein